MRGAGTQPEIYQSEVNRCISGPQLISIGKMLFGDCECVALQQTGDLLVVYPTFTQQYGERH